MIQTCQIPQKNVIFTLNLLSCLALDEQISAAKYEAASSFFTFCLLNKTNK